MDVPRSQITVLFEEPFWICLYECEENGSYTVCKITFGAEPKDQQVYAFLLKKHSQLVFSSPQKASATSEKPINPKRMQRQIRQQVKPTGLGTKAQQALKQQQEAGKMARKTVSRAEKMAEKERQFSLQQEKRKEKHKGH